MTPRALDTRPGVGARFGAPRWAIAGDAAPLAEVSAAGALPAPCPPPGNNAPSKAQGLPEGVAHHGARGSADDVEIGGERVGFERSKGRQGASRGTILTLYEYHVLRVVRRFGRGGVGGCVRGGAGVVRGCNAVKFLSNNTVWKKYLKLRRGFKY